MVDAFHAKALTALESAADGLDNAAFAALSQLAERLALRDS